MTRTLTLRRPIDAHVHFRDGALLAATAPDTAQAFAAAIVMPNLVPPVVTAQDARAYRDRIGAALGEAAFTPLMTLYLTDTTEAEDVAAAAATGLIHAVKLYPAGATTNSDSGVTDFDKVTGVLEKMAEIGLPLCIHGEVTRAEVDIFDREAVFIEEVLDPLRRRIPGLRVVLEHITTETAVSYVASADDGLAATITLHHLMINRTDIFRGGIRPHYFCLPIAKREAHRQALRKAAASGDARFFFGSDSAPHTDGAKLAPCGCAGCYTAPIAMPYLAQIFEEMGALPQLEGFTHTAAAAWYGLARSAATLTLEKSESPVARPGSRASGDGPVTVFDPEQPLFWQLSKEV